jgi:eukaryotic translation initiation factor 2C
MLKIGATRLAYPRIMYGNKTQVIDEHRARWNLQDSRFLKTNDCTVAYAFLPEDGVQDRHITGFRGEFCRQLRELRVGMPQSIELHTGPIRTRHSACNDDIRARLREAKRRGANVAVLVLRSANQDVYSTFKYLADRVFGIASIVMVEASGYRGGKSSGLAQYIGNIMMKANLKMGGINHSAESKQGNIKRCLQNTLVLGADVTHPSGGALLGCPSVAALVGSVENTGGKFLGSLSLQSKGKKEVSQTEYFLHKY